MNSRDFPRVSFYDQDFVEIYDRTWSWISDSWVSGAAETPLAKMKFLCHQGEAVLDLFDQVFASFFLVYSNRIYPATSGLDALYLLQESDGAIRGRYEIATCKPIFAADNPEGLALPLLAWAEFNLYHKTANKKRVREIMPILRKNWEWMEAHFKHANGLFATPLSSIGMDNTPRAAAHFFQDFNSAMAMNALYLSALSDILNDKDSSFQFKRAYFSLKTRINSLMWNAVEGFYYDLDKNEKQVKVKTIGGFWPLMAEIPNEDKTEKLIAHLKDPKVFGTEHPFPTLAADQKGFDKRGMGFRGSVVPPFTYMVIKGLEKYNQFELARNCAIRHLYFVLDSMHQNEGSKDGERSKKVESKQVIWEAYMPQGEGKALWPDRQGWPRQQHFAWGGLSSIALMIENIVGLDISLPRKTVDWIIPNLEIMGIENLGLKRNFVTILSNKSGRGWEIHMESEKLYYFTINVIGRKKKTLPIPSGKCSMLIDKI